MTPKLITCLLLTALSGVYGVAHAERADRDKPMNIEADALRHDELKQTSVFTGNVVMTKGTIVLRGAQLDVRQDAEGYQHGTIKADTGKRAYFRQKRDTPPGAPDEFVEGEGEVIEYNGKTDDVKLIRRAQLRRYTGGKLSDDIMGSIITYNNLTDVFTVDGEKRTNQPSSAPAGSGGRVRAILAPKASSSTQPSTAPAQPLQPSSELNLQGK
ncbi:lipopolysaccharide transport periplasmic protein LptA [Comamonas sp. NoAH]|uniref:lipopolysaccharide transport periplasmic protein LptA n=1 Tax=Comamonas halotolerans TaxID=3041496 RepID=UPI0024E087A9|nr:lipopolysaccharide transport periplasmic protein LptA [Comamonas sp. NoAH]